MVMATLPVTRDEENNEPQPYISREISYDSDDESQQSQDGSIKFDSLKDLPPRERNMKYWEWCYGSDQSLELAPSWSAIREAPQKGCLSISKIGPSTSREARFATPSKKDENVKRKSIQFGLPTAAEYDLSCPSGMLTPLPMEVARRRYSMDPKVSTAIEEEVTQETKDNSAILAEWEDKFEEPRTRFSRRRKRRRSSSLFAPNTPYAGKGLMGIDSSPPVEKEKSLNISPSIVVRLTDDLTSLRMTSPLSPHQPSENESLPCKKLDLLESLDLPEGERNSSAAAVLDGSILIADQEEFSENVNDDTIDRAICINSINGNGGAIDAPSPMPINAPVLSSGESFTSTSTELYFGSARCRGSIDDYADAETPRAGAALRTSFSPPMPVARLEVDDEVRSYDRSKKDKEAKKMMVKSPEALDFMQHPENDGSVDIVLMMLKRPNLEQEWGYETLLKNIASHNILQSDIERYLATLTGHDAGALRCLEHILEGFESEADSPPVVSPMSEHPSELYEEAVCEWRHRETQILEQVLDSIQSDAIACGVEWESLLEESDRPIQPILELENDVSELKSTASSLRGVLSALDAPSEQILCQALCHISDWTLEEHSEYALRVLFCHPIEGAASSYSFYRDDGSFISNDDSQVGEHQWTAIRRGHFASKFHRFFLDWLMKDGTYPFNDDGCDLCDKLLAVSVWLGRLNVATLDFKSSIEACRRVVVSMPSATFYLDHDVCLRVKYDLGEVRANPFAPSKIEVTQHGEAVDVLTEFGVTLSDYLLRVIEEIFSN